MKIKIESSPHSAELISLEGDLDFGSSPDARREFGKIADKQPSKVIVNLEKVNYIDSSGLATFIELFQKIKKSGGRLALFNLRQSVRNVFEIAKLDSVFSLAKSEEEALNLIAS